MTQEATAPAPTASAALARAIVKSFERASLRGAPTLFGMLRKFGPFKQSVGEVRLRGGQRFRFPAFDDYWCRYLWAAKTYEPDVELVFRRIAGGRLLIDCGANIGYWSARSAELGFSDAIAVEANPALIPYLRWNVCTNLPSGRVVHAAIHRDSGETLLLGRSETHACAGVADEGIPVVSVHLAGLVEDRPDSEPIIVKLDVEGAEIPAIDGAEGHDNFIYVYEDWAQHRMPVTAELVARGYCVFGLDHSGNLSAIRDADDAVRFNERTVARKGPSNLVACSTRLAPTIGAELAS